MAAVSEGSLGNPMSRACRQYSCCWIWSLFVFGASALAYQASAWGAGPVDAEHLTLIGRVFIEPVDARRVLVAVTTRMDGSSEHLFLYTASTPLNVTPRFRNLLATVYYETDGGLRITPAVNDAQILEFVVTAGFETKGSADSVVHFEQTLGLSHYVANPRLQMWDLQAFNKTGDCDHAPRACVQVAGQFLPFPG